MYVKIFNTIYDISSFQWYEYTVPPWTPTRHAVTHLHPSLSPIEGGKWKYIFYFPHKNFFRENAH